MIFKFNLLEKELLVELTNLDIVLFLFMILIL